MARSQTIACLSVGAAFFIIVTNVWAAVVNPHWTGKHCGECHMEGRMPALRFEGALEMVCGRCHDRKTAATFEPHPVQIPLSEGVRHRMPSSWPLHEGRLSCRTCHNITVQMYDMPAEKILNPDFLRISSRQERTEFCFFCHDVDRFKKKNPHKQRHLDGSIDRDTCLICHQTYPEPDMPKEYQQLSLVTESPLLCGACHAEHMRNHPAATNHLVTPEKDLRQKDALSGVTLPFIHNTIHCATCHDPHEQGIRASHRVRGPFALRTDTAAQLCITCHHDKTPRDRSSIHHERQLLKRTPQPMAYHKPWAEKKCKVCHAISLERREKPEALHLCFQQGCHDTAMLKKPFLHEESVLAQCFFCHENHGSEYGKLLRTTEERLCFTCHLLMKAPGKKAVLDIPKKKELHDQFMAYMADKALGAGTECFYCHSQRHKSAINSIATSACADCHITVRSMIQQRVGEPLTVHDRFMQQRCSACHNPHGAEYPYVLKKPAAAYR
ncbi:MAG: cytochrome c3 family protein [Desulfobacterota bacterium]|nr:cytochrome c3 family protein [Thermodesulfobacteriota bacterium]